MRTRSMLLITIPLAVCFVAGYAFWLDWVPQAVNAPVNESSGTVTDHGTPLRGPVGEQTGEPAPNAPSIHGGESSDAPKKFQRTYWGVIRFDYSGLPDDAQGNLVIREEGTNLPWFESPLSRRPEYKDRLRAGSYYVMVVGETTWKSETISLAQHDEVTVVLGQGLSQSVSVLVTDADTGAPLEGAVLMLSCRRSPTNHPKNVTGLIALAGADGRATLTGQPVEAMQYTVEKFGYEPVELSSHPILGGECFLGTVAMTRATGTFRLVYDLSGLELKDGETAKVYTELEDLRHYQYVGGGGLRQPVSGDLFWYGAHSSSLSAERTFGGMVNNRRHAVVVDVLIRNAEGDIVRNGQYISNDIYAHTGTLTVTLKDLKMSER